MAALDFEATGAGDPTCYPTRVEGRVLETVSADPRLNVQKLLNIAVESSGRGPGAVAADMAKRLFGAQGLTPQEYFQFRLYDPAKSVDDKRAYLGARGSRRLNDLFNDLKTAPRFVDDKVLCGAMLRGLGTPAADLQAIAGGGRVAGARVLENPAAAAAFFANTAIYPLFCKPRFGSESCGALSVDGYDQTTGDLLLAGGRRAAAAAVAEEAMRAYPGGWLIQSRVTQHPALSAICGPAAATVRMVTARRDGQAAPFYALWKIPRVGAVADNFWRSGNMIAHLDVARGAVKRVQHSVGPDAADVSGHPDTGAVLDGIELPYWDDLRETVCAAADALPQLTMIGWDVAISIDGPVIIEANGAPMHTMYQHASGAGLLTPEVKALALEAKAVRAARRKHETAARKHSTRAKRARTAAALRAAKSHA